MGYHTLKVWSKQRKAHLYSLRSISKTNIDVDVDVIVKRYHLGNIILGVSRIEGEGQPQSAKKSGALSNHTLKVWSKC